MGWWRHPRRLAPLALFAAAIAPTPTSAAACGGSGARTELVRGDVRIVRIAARDTLAFCWRGGRAHRIFVPVGETWEPAVRHVTVTGGVLAYELTYFSDRSAGASTVHEVDARRLRTGRRLTHAGLGVGAANYAAVRRLVVTARGALGWSDRAFLGDLASGATPVAADRVMASSPGSAQPTVLDRATAAGTGPTALDLRSLRLDGATLRWTSGGVARSAVLR